MADIYLHDHKDFSVLLRIIEEEAGILAGLVEKDYWIMHVLYGLKKQNYQFQLKGGTSLSKGFGIINRFSEDIDLHIDPPPALAINENPNNSNPANIARKKGYYDKLASEIKIDGITKVERDIAFDDVARYNSGGIRLYYTTAASKIEGVKEGMLLEAGYDNVAPNSPVTITSWAYEKAKQTTGINIIDNRAVDILCYDIRYTFVEKLQTIATKFRKEMETGNIATNYMRQYYDVYSLLNVQSVIDFIGTEEYLAHKEKRFPTVDFAIPVKKNEAFLLTDKDVKTRFRKRYENTQALYYKGQPSLDEILDKIHEHIDRL
jgi:hypothetical protein